VRGRLQESFEKTQHEALHARCGAAGQSAA
jgi:hypothetical protein